MSSIHHFGDSYGTIYSKNYKLGKELGFSHHFVEICAREMGMNYFNHSIPGLSNEMILRELLHFMYEIKPNDIVFINFSFLARGTYYDESSEKIKTTSNLFDEINNKRAFENTNGDEKLLHLIEYYLDYTEDYARRIFELYKQVFKYLIDIGCFIYYIHIDDAPYIDSLLDFGFNIKFENGFGKWLKQNNFHNEEEGHYSKNIQKMLSELVLKNTNNFAKNMYKNNVSELIKFSDFDENLINEIKKNIL